MKNPLRKRFFRELREEIGKYLVVFILMAATIGFVSGFLVADGSMLTAYNNSFQKMESLKQKKKYIKINRKISKKKG